MSNFNKVQHFEIPSDNMERAGKFYQSVFGWKVMDSGMEGMKYHFTGGSEVDENGKVKETGSINGAIMERDTQVAPNPVITITVEDIEKTLEKIEESGGSKVMEKTEIPKMGWFGYAKDSEGNVIGLWQDIKG